MLNTVRLRAGRTNSSSVIFWGERAWGREFRGEHQCPILSPYRHDFRISTKEENSRGAFRFGCLQADNHFEFVRLNDREISGFALDNLCGTDPDKSTLFKTQLLRDAGTVSLHPAQEANMCECPIDRTTMRKTVERRSLLKLAAAASAPGLHSFRPRLPNPPKRRQSRKPSCCPMPRSTD